MNEHVGLIGGPSAGRALANAEASLIVSSRFAHATICARAACASASPHYDPDSRRSHGRRGLSLSLAGLLLMGLELASLPLAECCVARNAIERCTA
jgi:hypothetical protein